MSDATDATQPGGSGISPARRARLLVILASVLLLMGSAVSGYFLGRDLAKRPLAEAQQLVHQMQPEMQTLKSQIDQQSSTILSLETRLKKAESALSALRPKKDTYKITANQSLIVADGKLTIGVVGPPTINGVLLNINGKQHNAVTGDLFEVTPDPSTKCSVKVQSFDMFEVYINVTCAKAG